MEIQFCHFLTPFKNIFGPPLENPLLAPPWKKIPALMFRGTCSSIEMLKGYMDRQSMGNPALEQAVIIISILNF